MTSAQTLKSLLGLRAEPVAITFRASAPAGVPHVAKAGPSGCSYWKRAVQGETFYTEATDHYNCPIGAYTHGVDLPAAQGKELEAVLGTMFQLGYIRPDEIPAIPRRTAKFSVAVYAPLSKAAGDPDIVLIVGNAKQIMLLSEAAQAAGVGGTAGLMGRPTCAAIPQAMQTGAGVASLGCIGNRIYTEMGDDELYFAVPGKHVAAVVEKLVTIHNANRELEKYHRERCAAIAG
jgi:uncharacterized protein (DUF169 family)